MTFKLSPLSSEQTYQLNLQVALLEGWELDPLRPAEEGQMRRLHSQRPSYDDNHYISYGDYHYAIIGLDYSPVTNWNQAGPIIEEKGINIYKSTDGRFGQPVYDNGYFMAFNYSSATYLEAAMKAYVQCDIDI